MNIVNQKNTKIGRSGEKLLASGTHISMRLWNESPCDKKQSTSHQCNYEVVGYVVSGSAQLIIGDRTLSLHPGDSWVVPEGVDHCYQILEDFTAVEATYPSAH